MKLDFNTETIYADDDDKYIKRKIKIDGTFWKFIFLFRITV